MLSFELFLDEVEIVLVVLGNGEFRIGVDDVLIDVWLMVGYCSFVLLDLVLLVLLLLEFVYVCGE